MKSAADRALSIFFWRRVALAPLCLLLVAGLHLYRVKMADQSPWKGGGFGMFSTVDAPGARFVKAYLVTAGGRVPVEIPPRLAAPNSALLTAPSQVQLQALAEEFAKQTWVDEVRRDERIARRLEVRADSQSPLTAAQLRTRRDLDATPALEKHFGQPSGLVAVGGVDERRQRGDVVEFIRVELELWRYSYDRETKVLAAEPWLKASAPAP